jgi:phosphonoacetaldehyde hydrolase
MTPSTRIYQGSLKGVILDWAGTTIDHGSLAPALGFVELFKSQGVTISIAQARRDMGLAKKDHLRSILAQADVQQMWLAAHPDLPGESEIEDLYETFLPMQIEAIRHRAELIPGTLEAVATMRQMGLKIGSTTGYPRQLMEVLVPAAASAGYSPDTWVCPEDVPAGRPYPWMCYLNAMRLEIYPMAALVKVGDTLADIAEGVNAGMWSVGLSHTGNGLGLTVAQLAAQEAELTRQQTAAVAEAMFQAGAHYVVPGIAEVPAVLREIQQRLLRGDNPLG